MAHRHGPGCGHTAIRQGDDVEAHRLEVSEQNPIGVRLTIDALSTSGTGTLKRWARTGTIRPSRTATTLTSSMRDAFTIITATTATIRGRCRSSKCDSAARRRTLTGHSEPQRTLERGGVNSMWRSRLPERLPRSRVTSINRSAPPRC
jgi:hypothetical protein